MRKLAPLLLLLLAVSSPVFAAGISPEAKACFEWFATLGHPDVKDAPWAEVWTGSWSTTGNADPPTIYTTGAFVLSQDAGTFHIFRPDLTGGILIRSKPDVRKEARVGFEERRFTDMVKATLDDLRNPKKDAWSRFRAKLGHKAEVFVLADACWRKGESKLAQDLFDEAAKLPAHSRIEDTKKPMREALEIEFGHAAMWSAVVEFGELGFYWGDRRYGEGLIPRKELLETFRKIVRLYPRSQHIERAKKTVAILDRMVKEDAAHNAVGGDELAKLPVEKQVAELIFQLRDQNGHQFSQPGWCDIFDHGRDGKSPAESLRKIGYPAVPQLIEALGDERFSRSVGYHRDFHFSHTVLTVGDCAQQILNAIGGQRFYAPRSTSGYMSRDDEIAATKKVVQAWWDEFQKKGEQQSLIDAISSGEKDPGPLVDKLRKLDALAADRSILAGAPKSKEHAEGFIRHLAQIKEQAATDQLLARMKVDVDLHIRLAAAARLLGKDHPDALPAVIHEWKRFERGDGHGPRRDFELMGKILRASGKEIAMKELVEGWDRRPVDERIEIVSLLGSIRGGREIDPWTGLKAKPAEPGAEAVAFELLAHALEDTEARIGMTGSSGDFSYTDPRICDFALNNLNRLDPKRYPFSPHAGRRQHDLERITAANVWRSANQKPMLPVPQVTLPKLAENDALKITVLDIRGSEKIAGSKLEPHIAKLKGGTFAPSTIPRLLAWFASHPTKGVSGLSVEAIREADLTGVEIRIVLTPGQYPGEGTWNIHHSGNFADHRLGSTSGGCSLSSAREEKYWQDFSDGIAKGLKSPPATGFIISAGISASR